MRKAAFIIGVLVALALLAGCVVTSTSSGSIRNTVFFSEMSGSHERGIGKVHGTVFLDKNNDGMRDFEEEVVCGAEVVLLYRGGKWFVTEPSGEFLFTEIESGEYRIDIRNIPKGFKMREIYTVRINPITHPTAPINLAVIVDDSLSQE